MKKLKHIWKDPVWSNAIAGIIVAFITLIWNIISSILFNNNFLLSFITFWNFKISLWIVFVSFFIFFSSFSIYKYYHKTSFKYNKKTQIFDQALFEKIKSLLPIQNGSISYMRDNLPRNFCLDPDFDKAKLIDLFEFEYYFRNPDCFFFHPLLETSKNELIRNISKFRIQLEIHFIHQHLLISEELINDGAALINEYDSFIKLSRQILYI
jgi:hypothetical protein